MVEPSEELQVVFDKAIKDAKRLEHEYVTLEHLLFAMLCTENFTNILKGFGIDVQPLQNDILSNIISDTINRSNDMAKLRIY